ncbi:calpain-9-like [Stegodyphus dumicola]|uniref:calpain-9-like n=1 Tax=Stegodyphus dumicola TaxID=202533 RepID=UPI0015AF09F8|nr:calpain-9-like [Stegodyphus dumicola]
MGSGCSRAETSAVCPTAPISDPVDPLPPPSPDMGAGKDRRVSIRDPLVGHQRMGGDKSPPLPNVPSHLPPRATRRDVDRVKGSRPPSPLNYEQRWGERDDDVEEEAFDISDISDDSDEIADDENVLRSLALLRIGQLFMDANFPPLESSLYYSHRLVEGKVTWMRPHEMIPEPKLLIDTISRHDIVQGVLADCWFLSSCAAVAQRPDLMRRVIAPYQPLYGFGYRGIVRFRFWRFGKWINVYIDDLLPTREGELLFSRCSDRREFWVALLEKAYANLSKLRSLLTEQELTIARLEGQLEETRSSVTLKCTHQNTVHSKDENNQVPEEEDEANLSLYTEVVKRGRRKGIKGKSTADNCQNDFHRKAEPVLLVKGKDEDRTPDSIGHSSLIPLSLRNWESR